MLNERFLLIPTMGSICAIRQHLDEHSDDYMPDEEETREMLQMAIDFLKTAPLLELYSKVVSGEPGRN